MDISIIYYQTAERFLFLAKFRKRNPHGVIDKMLDCSLKVNKFEI